MKPSTSACVDIHHMFRLAFSLARLTKTVKCHQEINRCPVFNKKMEKHKQNLSSLFDEVKSSGNRMVSVELCPNRDLNVEALKKLSPAFCSIMWPVPDTELNKPSEMPAILQSEQISSLGFPVLLHLPGRHFTKSQLLDTLTKLQRINVRNLLALQGEPSPGVNDKPDFQYASDLIGFVRQNFGSYFCIGVAAYPQAHPVSQNQSDDLKYLKMKVDAGADFIITQMVFDSKVFSQFVNECKDVDINVPIIPGVYIITSLNGLNQMASFCRVKVPENIIAALTDKQNDPEAIRSYGKIQCSQLVKDLLSAQDAQVVGVHFFSLNNVDLVQEVLSLCDTSIECHVQRK